MWGSLLCFRPFAGTSGRGDGGVWIYEIYFEILFERQVVSVRSNDGTLTSRDDTFARCNLT